MTSADLIDTTEMYLKTIYELEEDGVVPLRARIVERLGHSGPTVSQTIGRMERDGLVTVRGDRRLELTNEGRKVAWEVMRKHRLAERLLVDVIGLDWASAHEEACRWEHVMSIEVEDRLPALVANPDYDPYGNPVPGRGRKPAGEQSVDALVEAATDEQAQRGLLVRVSRIGEPIQAKEGLLSLLQKAGIGPGSEVVVKQGQDSTLISLHEQDGSPSADRDSFVVSTQMAPHFFVTAL